MIRSATLTVPWHDQQQPGRSIDAAFAHRAIVDTFLLGAVHHTVAMTVYKAPGFDIEKDLMPITGVAYEPDVLVINSKLPAANVRELIAYAKANRHGSTTARRATAPRATWPARSSTG